jgi:hypothetical protein
LNPNRYAISLRLWHPSIDPEEITSALGLSPTRSWRAGAPRTTPKETPLEGANRETYWCADMGKGEWPGINLAAAIARSVDVLTPHRDFLRHIHAESGRSEFFVGWFFEGNSGDQFDAALLAKLADLQIGLALDIYPPDQPQNDF